MKTKPLSALTLALFTLAAGCEAEQMGLRTGEMTGPPPSTSGNGGKTIWPPPDYTVVVRAMLTVDAQQHVTEATGDVLLKKGKVPGDAYLMKPGVLSDTSTESFQQQFAVAEATGRTVPIDAPAADISIPIVEFRLWDLSVKQSFTFLIRSRDPNSGVVSYQRLVVEFDPAVLE